MRACRFSISSVGVRAAAATTSNASARRAAKVDAGGQIEQAVDGLDVELVVDQLDDQHHDRAGAADVSRPAARSSSR